MIGMKIAATCANPKRLHPYCNVCGWRKGGKDSWDGKSCKCKHDAAAMACVDCEKVTTETGGVSTRCLMHI